MARRRRHSWGEKSAGSNFVSTLGKKQESVQKCDGKQIPCQHSVWRSDSRCYARFHWIMDLSEISFWYWLTHILDDFDEVCVEFWEFSLCSQQTEYLNCSHSYSRILTPLHNGLMRIEFRQDEAECLVCWCGIMTRSGKWRMSRYTKEHSSLLETGDTSWRVRASEHCPR